MTQTTKGTLRRQAWRAFLIQSGLSVAVIVLALLPAALFDDRTLTVIALLGASLVVLAISVAAASRLMRLLETANDKIATLTTHDDLTGLPNRRWFFDRLDEEVDRARRYGNELSLIMVDIDHFRQVNDTFGHPLGDLALAEVARLLSANIRTSDIVARYGGEEFVIIIPESGAEKTVQAAEKLRMVVEVNDISLEGPEVKVTVSCGVADLKSVVPGKGGLRDALVLAADHALHRAKENGRNQTLMHVAEHERQLPLV
ncbi:MAG: GGDEF domain-containing protein [Pseudodesulfovibrio sp.]|jgi:diguanylate cyclase (GGDEF)-like protein|uniref:diguanylate cyclase n=1 Tax=Pseudodesulfovibrio indicus TaxID=1716143 RepID=A0AA94PKD5_9BACT|nr:GGDEF domain-containing protein [Pseudodesulfovibrio indicus]TDT82690.1 diguanylate cyclase (GGDEF)-like protein [Pseudodesulfovibrio indicus]